MLCSGLRSAGKKVVCCAVVLEEQARKWYAVQWS